MIRERPRFPGTMNQPHDDVTLVEFQIQPRNSVRYFLDSHECGIRREDMANTRNV